MNHRDFQLRNGADPRLAAHAASPSPAWLWSTDGTRILWANPAGAKLFGAADALALASKTFGPADPHRRQVAQLAGRLLPTGATRLARLRGVRAALGAPVHPALARAGRSARFSPAPARGWFLPTAAPEFWWSRCLPRPSCSGSVPRRG